MKPEAVRSTKYTTTEAVLYMAFELSNSKWKLGFTVGLGQRPRERNITAGDLAALQREIDLARKRYELPVVAGVQSCYEAGRDGFWLHRYLTQAGIPNLVVDSASIQVSRRAKHVKTDRLDVNKLLTMLIHYHQGDKKVWRVVRVPSLEQEDHRQLHRDLLALKGERTQHLNRLKGLLVSQGVRLPIHSDFVTQLEQMRLWDGTPLPHGLRARLAREYARLQFVEGQIHGLQAERNIALRESQDPALTMVRQLLRLRGIGIESAWLYTMEVFAWRELRNRREVGALAGLTPTPDKSGDRSREKGISKAGNRRMRAMAIEIAWSWLRYQPDSALSRWFEERFAQGGQRTRKIGIVALARKLLVELWHYLQSGVIPAGAELKA